MREADRLLAEFQARIQRARAEVKGQHYSSTSADREVFMDHALHEERRLKAEAKRLANRRAFISAARNAAKGKRNGKAKG